MAENEHKNDWDLWAIGRSYSKRNNSVVDDQSVHEDPTNGKSVNNTQVTTLFQEKSDYVGDFTDSFSMESKRYFGLEEVISLSKNLNTNSRNEPETETIPNAPLVIVENEEEKKNKNKNKRARYSKGSSSNERYEVSAEKLSEADQWRWKKYRCQTGKNYCKCNEVEYCPARRQVEQSSTDPNKLIVTCIGKHNHLPPNQHAHCNATQEPYAAVPVEHPSFPSARLLKQK